MLLRTNMANYPFHPFLSRALANHLTVLYIYSNLNRLNPLYTGGHFHCYMLDESILGVSCLLCHF